MAFTPFFFLEIMTRFVWVRRWALIPLVITATNCHGLLDVSNPTLIRNQDIANASGANGDRLNTSAAFLADMYNIIPDIAYFSDEWTMDMPSGLDVTGPFAAQLDLRNSEAIEQSHVAHLGSLQHTYWQTSIAIPAVRAYTPDSLKGDFLAQLYAIRGYVVLQMAEDLCSGFPLSDVVENRTVYGGPVTTDSAVALANVFLDSAVKYARDSTRFVTFARVVKGRALLDQGKYTEAAAVVATVPTTSMYSTMAGGFQPAVNMGPSNYCDGCVNTVLGDREGTNGLPFASAQDPRIPLQILGVSQTDSSDTIYATTKGLGSEDVQVYASGIEARLMQAEAAVNQNDASWKPILDTLRSTVGLDSLTDPGSMAGRIDLVYRERAFWLFMTGRRLGDLRRLVKNYGRAPETVFPTGVYRGGGNSGSYGTATAIPFDFASQAHYNPYITTGCLSR